MVFALARAVAKIGRFVLKTAITLSRHFVL
jgi:hypothetical protein